MIRWQRRRQTPASRGPKRVLGGHNSERQTRDVKGAKDRDVESVEGVEKWGGGIPLPNRLEGLEERHKLPQRGPGQ